MDWTDWLDLGFITLNKTNFLAFNLQTLIIHLPLKLWITYSKLIGWRRQLNRHAFPDCVRRFLLLPAGDQLVLVVGDEPLSSGEIEIRRTSLRHVTTEQDADRGRIKSRVFVIVQSTLHISLSGFQLLEQRKTLSTLLLHPMFIYCSTGLRQLQGDSQFKFVCRISQ